MTNILGSVFWNHAPMTLRTGDPSDSFTLRGQVWYNGLVFYTNLPSTVQRRFPMYGTNDINTGNDNILVIKTTMIAYLLRVSGWNAIADLDEWRLVNTGKYLGNEFPLVNLYEKIFHPGTYIVDNDSAMYLFSDDLPSKFLTNDPYA